MPIVCKSRAEWYRTAAQVPGSRMYHYKGLYIVVRPGEKFTKSFVDAALAKMKKAKAKSKSKAVAKKRRVKSKSKSKAKPKPKPKPKPKMLPALPKEAREVVEEVKKAAKTATVQPQKTEKKPAVSKPSVSESKKTVSKTTTKTVAKDQPSLNRILAEKKRKTSVSPKQQPKKSMPATPREEPSILKQVLGELKKTTSKAAPKPESSLSRKSVKTAIALPKEDRDILNKIVEETRKKSVSAKSRPKTTSKPTAKKTATAKKTQPKTKPKPTTTPKPLLSALPKEEEEVLKQIISEVGKTSVLPPKTTVSTKPEPPPQKTETKKTPSSRTMPIPREEESVLREIEKKTGIKFESKTYIAPAPAQTQKTTTPNKYTPKPLHVLPREEASILEQFVEETHVTPVTPLVAPPPPKTETPTTIPKHLPKEEASVLLEMGVKEESLKEIGVSPETSTTITLDTSAVKGQPIGVTETGDVILLTDEGIKTGTEIVTEKAREEYERLLKEKQREAWSKILNDIEKQKKNLLNLATRQISEEEKRARDEFMRKLEEEANRALQMGVPEKEINKWKQKKIQEFEKNLSSWKRDALQSVKWQIAEWEKQAKTEAKESIYSWQARSLTEFERQLSQWREEFLAEQRRQMQIQEEIKRLIGDLQTLTPGTLEFEDIRKQLAEYGVTVTVEKKTPRDKTRETKTPSWETSTLSGLIIGTGTWLTDIPALGPFRYAFEPLGKTVRMAGGFLMPIEEAGRSLYSIITGQPQPNIPDIAGAGISSLGLEIKHGAIFRLLPGIEAHPHVSEELKEFLELPAEVQQGLLAGELFLAWTGKKAASGLVETVGLKTLAKTAATGAALDVGISQAIKTASGEGWLTPKELAQSAILGASLSVADIGIFAGAARFVPKLVASRAGRVALQTGFGGLAGYILSKGDVKTALKAAAFSGLLTAGIEYVGVPLFHEARVKFGKATRLRKAGTTLGAGGEKVPVWESPPLEELGGKRIRVVGSVTEKPVGTGGVTIESLIKEYVGKKVPASHATLDLGAFKGKSVLLRGFPEEARGWRKAAGMFHFYTAPGGEDFVNIYGGYMGIGAGYSGSTPKVRFGGKPGVVIARETYVSPELLPQPGESISEYLTRFSFASGKTGISPETVLGFSAERQLSTPASYMRFGVKLPGTLFTPEKVLSETFQIKQVPSGILGKIPILRTLLSRYTEFGVVVGKFAPVKETVSISKSLFAGLGSLPTAEMSSIPTVTVSPPFTAVPLQVISPTVSKTKPSSLLRISTPQYDVSSLVLDVSAPSLLSDLRQPSLSLRPLSPSKPAVSPLLTVSDLIFQPVKTPSKVRKVSSIKKETATSKLSQPSKPSAQRIPSTAILDVSVPSIKHEKKPSIPSVLSSMLESSPLISPPSKQTRTTYPSTSKLKPSPLSTSISDISIPSVKYEKKPSKPSISKMKPPSLTSPPLKQPKPPSAPRLRISRPPIISFPPRRISLTLTPPKISTPKISKEKPPAKPPKYPPRLPRYGFEVPLYRKRKVKSLKGKKWLVYNPIATPSDLYKTIMGGQKGKKKRRQKSINIAKIILGR